MCWEWTGATTARGYGQAWDGERTRGAHVLAREILVGPIPDGFELDHLCRNHACVNPDHTEPVTHAENVRRGASRFSTNLVAFHRGKTHCPQGHPYDEANTYVTTSGSRQCRTCGRLRHRSSMKEGTMPRNETTWMLARAVSVQGHARPHSYEAEDGETNTVGALMIQRSNGVGTLIIEGRPEELMRVANAIMRAAEEIDRATEDSPALRSLYGRTD